MDFLILPECVGEELDYQRYFVGTIRQWRKQIVPIIKESLDTYRDGWLDSLLTQITAAFNSLIPAVERDVSNIMGQVNSRQKKWWVKTVAKVTGLVPEAVDPFLTEPWLNDEMTVRVRENIQLIRNIEAQASQKLLYVIRNGARSGTGRKEIAMQVQAVLDSSESRAKIIARDQVQKHNCGLNQLRQQDAGIEEYRWSNSGDKIVRPLHREPRNGNIYRWDSPPPGGHPGEAVLCRCVAIAVFSAKIYQFPVKERYQSRAA